MRSWYDDIVRYFQGDDKDKKEGDKKDKGSQSDSQNRKRKSTVESTGTVHQPKGNRSRRQVIQDILDKDS